MLCQLLSMLCILEHNSIGSETLSTVEKACHSFRVSKGLLNHDTLAQGRSALMTAAV